MPRRRLNYDVAGKHALGAALRVLANRKSSLQAKQAAIDAIVGAQGAKLDDAEFSEIPEGWRSACKILADPGSSRKAKRSALALFKRRLS